MTCCDGETKISEGIRDAKNRRLCFTLHLLEKVVFLDLVIDIRQFDKTDGIT